MQPLATLPKQNSSAAYVLKQLLWRPLSCEGMVPVKSLIRTSWAILYIYFTIHKLGYLWDIIIAQIFFEITEKSDRQIITDSDSWKVK